MLQYFIMLLTVFMSLTFVPGSGSCFDEDAYEYGDPLKDDFVEVQVLEDKVTAFRSRKTPAPIRLEMDEEIVMQKEEGRIGALLTEDRFLVVSTGSRSWLSRSLETGEAATAELTVGKEIAMLVTEERILGFTARENRFCEYALPLGDEVIASDTGQKVGVVAFSDRAVGFSAASPRFREVEFQYTGSFCSLEMAASLALVHTDDHVYAYRAASGSWSVREKPAGE